MDQMQDQWAYEVAEKIRHKMRIVAERSRDKVPYSTVNGVYNDLSEENIGWWTNGFWGGMMWQLYNATKDEIYREIAERTEKKMDTALLEIKSMDHDSGFRWLPTSVANYRLFGKKESFNRAVLAADNLAGRFNPCGQFIRAWNSPAGQPGFKAGWAIIDCMMNLPLLYWAYEELKDPRYLQIATMHADKAQKYFVREDGSCHHIIEFDTMTGEYVTAYGGQGYAEGSSWTRGQAWGLYGFILSYIHTGNESYLNTAKRIANYFIVNTPESGLIPIDFRQPCDVTLEDSTASAIASCGLLEIAKALRQKGEMGETESRIYQKAAEKLLKVLAYERCNWDDNCDQIVEKCSAAYHFDSHETTIIYGDYYFIEAIWKLTEQEIFIW